MFSSGFSASIRPNKTMSGALVRSLKSFTWTDASLRPSGNFFYRWANVTGAWQASTQNLSGDLEYVSPLTRWIQQPDGQLCLIWPGSPDLSDLRNFGLYQRCLKGDTWSAADKVADTTIRLEHFQPALTPDGQLKMASVMNG
jgi:hypothetical protein